MILYIQEKKKRLIKRRYLKMTELQYYQELGTIIGKEISNIQEYEVLNYYGTNFMYSEIEDLADFIRGTYQADYDYQFTIMGEIPENGEVTTFNVDLNVNLKTLKFEMPKTDKYSKYVQGIIKDVTDFIKSFVRFMLQRFTKEFIELTEKFADKLKELGYYVENKKNLVTAEKSNLHTYIYWADLWERVMYDNYLIGWFVPVKAYKDKPLDKVTIEKQENEVKDVFEETVKPYMDKIITLYLSPVQI